MARKVIITLTEKEAGEVIVLMGAGYGDGDFYQLNNPEGGGDKRGDNTYWRAMVKIQNARALARRGGR